MILLTYLIGLSWLQISKRLLSTSDKSSESVNPKMKTFFVTLCTCATCPEVLVLLSQDPSADPAPGLAPAAGGPGESMQPETPPPAAGAESVGSMMKFELWYHNPVYSFNGFKPLLYYIFMLAFDKFDLTGWNCLTTIHKYYTASKSDKTI